MTITIKHIQQALKDKGFDAGPIDGIRGRQTISAIMAFQAAWRLKPDGAVGPQTLALLFPDSDAANIGVGSRLPWYAEAQRLIGITEDTSDSNNPLIIGWGRDLGLHYNDYEIPWCGLFVGHCVGSQLPNEPLPNNPLGARAWSRFGVEVTPQPGAIMVFWRESMASGKGHVGFYVSEDASTYLILGGNQSNAVNVARKPKDRWLNARWPKHAPAPTGGAVSADATGKTDGAEV